MASCRFPDRQGPTPPAATWRELATVLNGRYTGNGLASIVGGYSRSLTVSRWLRQPQHFLGVGQSNGRSAKTREDVHDDGIRHLVGENSRYDAAGHRSMQS